MNIERINLKVVDLLLEKPIRTAIHDMRSVGCVLVSIHADGVTGEGYCFALNAVRIKAFAELIRSYEPLIVGQPAHRIEGIWQNIWQSLNPMGQCGMTIGALAAVDTALWDLQGKMLNRPLHQLFGSCRDRIKTYASGGLWLSQSIDELQAEAQQFIDQGFTSMKIRVGKPDWRDDIQRVKAVRDVVGDSIELLTDANQVLNPKQAIRLADELSNYHVSWLEEPVAAHDLTGHAEVRGRVNMPIASGETVYTRYGMRDMIDKQACDILMPDLQRMGGLTEMRKVAALAASYNLPISTHIFTEHSLCIAGSAPNCLSVEHMPWFSRLFCEEMVIEQGDILIPDRPGTGFTFDSQYL
uniref:Mandelate racemase n=1 Tax=uncultured Thiotrichaceae bacterium TaxID=298394 RepID=A0A6S6TT94_9GAMM|nr:MAG: Mandelate racemase [uncultured Thiotrichaceae bacterium]